MSLPTIRTTLLLLIGATLSVAQVAPTREAHPGAECSVSFDHPQVLVGNHGGGGQLAFSASGVGCDFLSHQIQWIHVAFSPPGTTPGRYLLSYEAQANYSTARRVVTVPVAGSEIAFVQEPGKMRLAAGPGRLVISTMPNGPRQVKATLRAASPDGKPRILAKVREQDQSWLAVAPLRDAGEFEVLIDAVALKGEPAAGMLFLSSEDVENSPIFVPVEITPQLQDPRKTRSGSDTQRPPD